MIRIALKLKNLFWTSSGHISGLPLAIDLLRIFSQLVFLVTITSEVYSDDSDSVGGFYYNRI